MLTPRAVNISRAPIVEVLRGHALWDPSVIVPSGERGIAWVCSRLGRLVGRWLAASSRPSRMVRWAGLFSECFVGGGVGFGAEADADRVAFR